MNDLDITRLCAEAMGLTVVMQLGEWRFPRTQSEHSLYDPLHDDAQAMALVKRFAKVIVRRKGGDWSVNLDCARASDLNRAICECVARMQQAKGGGNG